MAELKCKLDGLKDGLRFARPQSIFTDLLFNIFDSSIKIVFDSPNISEELSCLRKVLIVFLRTIGHYFLKTFVFLWIDQVADDPAIES
jgi:hypothetical protein